MIKPLHIVIGLLAALTALIGASHCITAAEPPTRPDASARPDEDGRRGRGRESSERFGRDDRDDRGGRKDRDHRPPPPTEQEWEQTTAFLRDHAPHRLELFERFAAADRREGRSEPNRILQHVQARVHERVEDLEKLREKDPEMFDYAIAQFEAEDAIMAALMHMREARRAEDEKALQAAEKALNEAVATFVDRSLDERQARIDRLANELAKQRERLSRDRERSEELRERVRERYNRMLPRHLPPPTTTTTAPAPATRPSSSPEAEA